MKHPKLKLKAPKYKDEIVMEFSGDYNDGDYTYSTSIMTVDAYEFLLPLLKDCEGSHNWEDNDLESMAVEKLESQGFKEEDKFFEDVLEAVEQIHLYSDSGGCHTMEIEAVYFESASDNIRYTVKY